MAINCLRVCHGCADVLHLLVFASKQPSLTVLVPSYRANPEVVRATLLSAALQEYPDMRIVLLLDDPPNPSDADAAQSLVWTFAARFTSFERKASANLPHDANKAMNLNAYIGLMGRRVLPRIPLQATPLTGLGPSSALYFRAVSQRLRSRCPRVPIPSGIPTRRMWQAIVFSWERFLTRQNGGLKETNQARTFPAVLRGC